MQPHEIPPVQTEPHSPDRTLEFLAWLETNKRQLIYGLAAVLAACVFIYILRFNRAESEMSASNELFILESKLDSGEGLKASEFSVITREHGGTSAGRHALLFAAEKLYSEGKFESAKASFSEFLKVEKDATFRAVAEFGIAACDEADGNSEAAAKVYARLASRDDVIGVRALLAQGILSERKGKVEDAKQIYQKVRDSKLASHWAREAGQRFDKMMAAHPELRPKPITPFLPTNSIPTPATNPPSKR